MAIETTATLTAAIKPFYDRGLLERATPALVHSQWGQERIIPMNVGKSIEFRKYNSLAAATSALTEGTVPSETALTTSTVTATLAQYGAYIKGSDLLLWTTFDPILAEYSEILGEQAGDTIDQIVRDVLAAGTSVRYMGTKVCRGQVGSGDIISATEVRKLYRELQRQNARPVSGRYYGMFVHPNTAYDLRSDSTFLNTQYYANERGDSNALFTNEINRWLGFVIVETSNAKWLSGAGLSAADVYLTITTGADAYGITKLSENTLQTYYQGLGSGGISDPLHQIWTFGWKTAFAAVILNQSWIVRLEHVVTA